MTSGRPAARRVTSVRVSAGALAGVVETTPKSVKIAVARAPASSIASTSRRSETPVALRPSTVRPPWLRCRTRVQAAAVLPQFMHEPTSATTGTPAASSGAARSSGSPPIRAATPIRSPR